MFVRLRYKRKYCHNTIYIIVILHTMYEPGLDLSVEEIEEGDSILEHLGDVTGVPLCSSITITCPTGLNLLIFVICGPKNRRV